RGGIWKEGSRSRQAKGSRSEPQAGKAQEKTDSLGHAHGCSHAPKLKAKRPRTTGRVPAEARFHEDGGAIRRRGSAVGQRRTTPFRHPEARCQPSPLCPATRVGWRDEKL